MQHEKEREKFLLELPLLLNSTLDTETVIETALRYLGAFVQADEVVLVLGKNHERVRRWSLEQGDAQVQVENLSLPRQDCAAQALITREIVLEEAPEGRGLVQVAIPLITRGGKLVGAIRVTRIGAQGSFPQDDQQYIVQFGHYVALALDNVILFEQLKRSNEKLSMLNRRKEDMIMVLGHELRTPLGVFQGSLELIVSESLNPEQKERIFGTLMSSISRLIQISNELGEASLTQRKNLNLLRHNVELEPLWEVLRGHFGSAARERNITLEFELEPKELSVFADSALLFIALKNLLRNGIRFTPDGGEVRLKASLVEGGVRIQVEDTGVGIEPEQQELIFEKFYEIIDPSHHSSGNFEFQSGGLGLGLPTVKAIVEAHESKIQVETSPGKGSCFFFDLTTGT